MRPGLSLIVALALIAPATANAHTSTTLRLHNIRHDAVGMFGARVCGDTMRVTIRKGELPSGKSGYAERSRRGCLILLRDRRWTTAHLRWLVLHEYGHLAGLGHSNNPRSIMWSGVP